MQTSVTGLAPAKQVELQRALDDAAHDRVQPPLALGLMPAATAATAGPAAANLHILRHRSSGCIQLAFPPQTPTLPSAHALAPQDMDWIVHAALHVRDNMEQSAIAAIEAHNKTEGLLTLRPGGPHPTTADELAASRGRKVLLFVHGIFSSAPRAFSGLDDASLQQLAAHYDGHVYGYDHWTIAKTPQQNALDLLAHLPIESNWDVDFICHSRGALVVRSLLSGAVPAGQQNDDPAWNAIAQQRTGRIASAGKVFFVAAVNQGSPLASPEQIRNFLNVAAMLASFSEGMGLDVVIGLARMVVSLGYELPSVQALAGGSALIAGLNRHPGLLEGASIYYARANFDYSSSTLLNTGAMLDRWLIAADNDLVVPYDSVLLPAAQPADDNLLAFGTHGHKQNKVWHTDFFEQPEMRSFLLKHLT